MKDVFLTLFLCLVFTEVLEIGAALVLGVRSKRDILGVFFVNTLTNPVCVLLNMILGTFTHIPAALIITVLELAVWLTEALFYKSLLDYKKHSPFIVSLALNVVSFVIGSFAVWGVFRFL